MIYLKNRIDSVNYPIKQSFASQPMTSYNNAKGIKTDSVSFSADSTKNDKSKRKIGNLVAYIVGGLALAAGIVFTVIKIRNGKGSKNIADVADDIIKNEKKEENIVVPNVEKDISPVQKQDESIRDLDMQIAEANERVKAQEAK